MLYLYNFVNVSILWTYDLAKNLLFPYFLIKTFIYQRIFSYPMDTKFIHKLAEEEDLVVPTLFKPVQFRVIKKVDAGKKLTENEKRYLRGKMRNKVMILHALGCAASQQDELLLLLNSIGSYYITGLAALKYNGYGWYYEPKIIEVINTKIQGKLALKNKTLKFIRVRSISKSKVIVDKETHLRYAANEQIIKDTSFTKNQYARTIWKQMLERYGKMFVSKTKKYGLKEGKKIDYLQYGV